MELWLDGGGGELDGVGVCEDAADGWGVSDDGCPRFKFKSVTYSNPGVGWPGPAVLKTFGKPVLRASITLICWWMPAVFNGSVWNRDCRRLAYSSRALPNFPFFRAAEMAIAMICFRGRFLVPWWVNSEMFSETLPVRGMGHPV